MNNNYDLLYKLLSTPSPSGHELDIQKLIISEMSNVCDTFYKQDNMNLISVINEKSKVKVLLSGHIDEISLIIERINSDGTCSVCSNGGINPYNYIGQHVSIVTKSGLVPGVIGYVAGMSKGGLTVDDLQLDIGCYSKEEAAKIVSVGDPVVHEYSYKHLNNKIFTARALDDRLGAYICLETLRRVKERGCTNGVYVSTTVGEETSGRGANSATNLVKPTCALICDVTYANDVKHLQHAIGEVKLGKGPVLTFASVLNKKMHEEFVRLADEKNMPYQFDINTSRTYTDTDNIYPHFEGVPCYLISIPLRYMHSSCEVCDLEDVEKIIELFTDYICSLNEDTSFNPFDE